jgi:hypothetical protein
MKVKPRLKDYKFTEDGIHNKLEGFITIWGQ